MAREANLAKYGNGLREGVAAFINALERFEALVRADEREEKDRLRALCDELLSELYVYRASKYLKDTTEAIRARGETK
jgi:hypothetical protein